MKVILITGGAGFLGHALVERLLKTDVESLRVMSRNEGLQAQMRIRFPDPRLRPFLGDVCDLDMCRRACDGADGVIHGAALKRIQNCVDNPWLVARINIDGSKNICEAARESRSVKSVVLVSSDKAFAPVSAYGNSKAVAEDTFRSYEMHRLPRHPHYHVVRYGNVWGSTGSVMPVWRETIKNGGVCEVRNLDATRFFMLVDEAVDWVLGGLRGEHPLGQPAIPFLLPAYDLGSLVEAMRLPRYVITKLPWYEKLHESMCEGVCSKDARRMSVEELRGHLEQS